MDPSSTTPAKHLTIAIPLHRGSLILLLASLGVILAGVAAGLLFHVMASSRSEPGLGSGTTLGKRGEWGQLEYRSILLEMPDEFAYLPPFDPKPTPWVFQGLTREAALETLRTAGASTSQLATFTALPWTSVAAGCQVIPDDETVLALAPPVRAVLYGLLDRSETDTFYTFSFDHDKIEDVLKENGLAPASLALLRQLLYPKSKTTWSFADTGLAMRRLPDNQERRRFIQVLSRKETLLIRLRIDRTSDLHDMINYWGANGRRREVESLLGALYREEDGGAIQIACLLPAFARNHLYLFPRYFDGRFTTAWQDCAWSAMNFFNEVPDDRFTKADNIQATLTADYYQIHNPGQVGDLVFLTRTNGTVLHCASYIADDVVFTKNGGNFTQPWGFMHLQDMLERYIHDGMGTEAVNVVYYRRKS